MSLGTDWTDYESREPRSGPDNVDTFDLDSPVCHFSELDAYTARMAMSGTAIWGSTGSGKTTGPGQLLALSFLRAGFGGLVLTVKPDECDLWRRYAKATGRSDQLIVFSPEERWRFNFLAYEQRRPGKGAGLTENIIQLLTTVQEAGNRREGETRQDPFWKNSTRQLMVNGVDLISLARPEGQLSVALLHEVISSAPRTLQEVDSEAWQQGSLCYRLLTEALAREDKMSSRQRQDLAVTGKYWLTEFPQLPYDTRGSVITTFTAIADIFLRGPIAELFSTGLNIVPEITHEGAILVLDLPIKEYGLAGLFAQILMKYIWQQATERRDVTRSPRPVFLWADEAHNFVNEHDVQFQTTARSSRACSVLLSQSLANYHYALGGEAKGKALTDALMGVLRTKVFTALSEPATMRWAADVLAKSWQQRAQSGVSQAENGGGGSNAGFSQSLDYNVQEEEFLRLRTGGPENEFCVDAIISQGGRTFSSTGKTFLKTTFKQEAI